MPMIREIVMDTETTGLNPRSGDRLVEIGGIELIAAQRTLSEARQAYVYSLFDYDLAIASLEKSIGRTLGEN